MPFASQENPRLTDDAGEQDRVKKLANAVRAAGVASVKGELLPRVAGIAVPVFDKDNRVILALTALGWTDEFDPNPRGTLAMKLKATGEAVSRSLGHRR